METTFLSLWWPHTIRALLLVPWKLLQRLFYWFSSFKGFSIVFLLLFSCFYRLKLDHLKSRMECGFSDIFSRHICSTVADTIGVTNYASSFGAKKCSENHISVHGTNKLFDSLYDAWTASHIIKMTLKPGPHVTIAEYVCRRCCKWDFRTVNISIANIYCERSILVIITRCRDQAIIVQP